MQEVKERKQFLEPELVKFKDSLDHVTMAVYGNDRTSSSSSSHSNNCNWLESLFNVDGC